MPKVLKISLAEKLISLWDVLWRVIHSGQCLYPDDIPARLTLILFYVFRNQLDEAIEAYHYILELDPERYSILPEIGALYEQQGNFELAYTQLQEAV